MWRLVLLSIFISIVICVPQNVCAQSLIQDGFNGDELPTHWRHIVGDPSNYSVANGQWNILNANGGYYDGNWTSSRFETDFVASDDFSIEMRYTYIRTSYRYFRVEVLNNDNEPMIYFEIWDSPSHWILIGQILGLGYSDPCYVEIPTGETPSDLVISRSGDVIDLGWSGSSRWQCNSTDTIGTIMLLFGQYDVHVPVQLQIDSIYAFASPCGLEDPDGDNVPNGGGESCDNCPVDYNPAQGDSDSDGHGDFCDVCGGYDDDIDVDNDGVADGCDNCPELYNVSQKDADDDGLGEPCDSCPQDADNDADSDDLCANVDNCPDHFNPGQVDSDDDGIGDECDRCEGSSDYADSDIDGVPDGCDNCLGQHNPLQLDTDDDGIGNLCDLDDDDDGVLDSEDNCQFMANPGQEDSNGNGLGDVCEDCCQVRVGDANFSGEDEPTIGDVSILIDAKFISSVCNGMILCLPEADINQSGGLEPTCDDITIGDVSALIDYLFIAGPEVGTLPDCL